MNIAIIKQPLIANKIARFVVYPTLFMLYSLSFNAAWAEQKEDPTKTTVAEVQNETPPPSQANNAKKTNPIKAPIDSTKQHKEDLEHYIASEQVKPLLAGPDDYITLFKKNTSVNNMGIAILIPEWQQGATNPKAINFLRHKLPSEGWHTLSIQPNNIPPNFPSEALTVADQKKENEVTLKEYKRKLSSMFNTVMNTAKEYPGIVLVIAQGNNGALLIDTLNKEGTQQPNAIILLSSYRQSNYQLVDSVNDSFAHQLAYTELPVLDLYLKHDNALVLAKAPQRKLIAKQELKTYYRQRQLNNTVTGYYPEKELLSQINGWLKAIGW